MPEYIVEVGFIEKNINWKTYESFPTAIDMLLCAIEFRDYLETSGNSCVYKVRTHINLTIH